MTAAHGIAHISFRYRVGLAALVAVALSMAVAPPTAQQPPPNPNPSQDPGEGQHKPPWPSRARASSGTCRQSRPRLCSCLCTTWGRLASPLNLFATTEEGHILFNTGMPGMLTAATATAADGFSPNRGRIVAGRRADLVLVRGDPTTDITASRDIASVWRSGVMFESSPCSLIIDR